MVSLANSELNNYYYCKAILLILHTGIDPALAGLALTYSITLTGLFQYSVTQSAEVESLVSSHNNIGIK